MSDAFGQLTSFEPPEFLPPLAEDPVAATAKKVFGIGVSKVPNKDLPDEPFYPHWTDSFQLDVIMEALRHLENLGYAVSVGPKEEPLTAPAAVSQPPVEQPKGFVKHDAGKTRFGLTPPWAREEVAKVFSHGAKKYPTYNFLIGTDWSRYIDAFYRHVSAWELGENKDPESGLSHLAHACACLMILISLQQLNKGSDDRPCNSL